MGNVRRSNRLDVAAAGLNGVFSVLDLLTGRTFNARGAVEGGANGYCHMDWQPETEDDWRVVREITNNNPRNPAWPARPILVTARNGTRFACALFTFNHAPILYRVAFNPGAPGNDAHCCIHFFTSRAERPGGSNNQYDRGHQACLDAERLGGAAPAPTPTPAPDPVTVNYRVEVTGSSVNIRAGAGTNTPIVSKNPVRPPRQFNIDREQQGPDGNTTTLWGRIADDPEFTRCHIALRLTRLVAASQPPPQPTGFWSVQCGALRTALQAELVLERLKAAGYDAERDHIRIADHDGLFRPRIGRLPTRAEALMLEVRLQSQGFDTWVLLE